MWPRVFNYGCFWTCGRRNSFETHSHLFSLSTNHVYKYITGESCNFCLLFWPYKCLQRVLMCQSGNYTNETKWPILSFANANFLASIINVFYWLIKGFSPAKIFLIFYLSKCHINVNELCLLQYSAGCVCIGRGAGCQMDCN